MFYQPCKSTNSQAVVLMFANESFEHICLFLWNISVFITSRWKGTKCVQYVPDFKQMVKCLACEIVGYNARSVVDYCCTPGYLHKQSFILEILHRFVSTVKCLFCVQQKKKNNMLVSKWWHMNLITGGLINACVIQKTHTNRVILEFVVWGTSWDWPWNTKLS